MVFFMNKLLLIDDDKEVLKINTKYFKQKEYEVEYATSAKSALNRLKKFTPDCIILDVMMPGIDGFKAFTKIRDLCAAPIIFLTGCDSEDDKINGLLLGADDYMIKPYSLRELEARIQVVIRRYGLINNASLSDNANCIELPPLTINLSKHKAYYKNTDNSTEELMLNNKEFELLHLLAASPNEVFSFDEIGQKVWGGYIESDRKTIMVTASRLRKKLDAYPELSKFIETEWAKGYKLIYNIK